MEQGIFWYLGGRCCFVAAIVARFINWDDMGCRVSGMVLRGVWCKGECLVFNGNGEDRFFIINWDHDCFMVDVDGIEGLSWLPGGPVELDIEVSTLDKGSKEVELIVMGVHVDEDDTIVSTQGEDGRGGKSCTGELVVD